MTFIQMQERFKTVEDRQSGKIGLPLLVPHLPVSVDSWYAGWCGCCCWPTHPRTQHPSRFCCSLLWNLARNDLAGLSSIGLQWGDSGGPIRIGASAVYLCDVFVLELGQVWDRKAKSSSFVWKASRRSSKLPEGRSTEVSGDKGENSYLEA